MPLRLVISRDYSLVNYMLGSVLHIRRIIDTFQVYRFCVYGIVSVEFTDIMEPLFRIKVTSQWASCRLKSPATPLFVYPFV